MSTASGSRSRRSARSNLISIGHKTFRLDNGTLTEFEDTGAITFDAHALTVQAGERRILDRVSFSLEPNNMLVIVGPSGSGKSTLLRALTGTRPATSGGVGYGGRDLYTNYDEIRHRIGLVPQDDILHPQLKVRGGAAVRRAAALPARRATRRTAPAASTRSSTSSASSARPSSGCRRCPAASASAPAPPWSC